MPWISKANLVAILLYGTAHLILTERTSAERVLNGLIGIFVIFLMPGFNLAVILQYCLKKTLSSIEFFTFSTASSLFIVPCILTVEYSKLGTLFPSLPLLNAVLIFLVLEVCIAFTLVKAKKGKGYFSSLPLSFTRSHLTKHFFSKEFIIPLVLYSAIILSITTTYYHLPDSDPYYWVAKYHTLFESQDLVHLSGDRPLFSSLAYIFHVGADIDLYAFFKYILPGFFIFLIFPARLLAQQFAHPLQKMVLFLFPFVNGITIIYLTLPIPQALANIALFFFFVFLSCSWILKENLFFLAAGITAFLGYFYHEVMALPFLIWCLIACFSFWKEIIEKIRKNPLTAFLLFLLVLPLLDGPWSFLVRRIQSSLLTSLAHIQPNLLFPQYYVNVDGNQMGWETLWGITKYYLFYIGPALFLTLLSFLFTKKDAIKKQAIFSREGLVFSLSFILFFSLAEIFPRVTGLAFLPDRAWVLAGPLALFYVLILFRLPLGRHQIFLFALMLSFCMNIGAAVYINTAKKYTFSNRQFVAAEWIRTSLPKNRVLFSIDNLYPLTLFSDSQVVIIDSPNFYYDTTFFTEQFLLQQQRLRNPNEVLEKKIIEIKKSIEEISTQDIQKGHINVMLSKSTELTQNLKELSIKLQNPKRQREEHFYVYYAAPNPKNPYLGRPYLKTLPDKESEMIFNKFPEKFKKIYSDEKEKIFIWEIL